MSREEFEKALECGWKAYFNGSRLVDQFEDNYVECAFSKGFKAGAEWDWPNETLDVYKQGYKDAVEKACKWLKSEYENIGIRYIRGCSSSDEVENFKKAMEDEKDTLQTQS